VPAPPSSRWLFGPLPDLILGCGLGYGLIFALLVFAGPELRRIAPDGLMPLALLLTGTPHYGATLLRVYERAEDRRAYVFFSVWATLAVWALFVVGLHSVLVGSLLLTVFLTWSPWHYTGQNYGVALMLLRRRGVNVTPTTKRLVYTSFLSSYFLTVLAIHGATESVDYAPLTYGSTVYRFLPLGIPVAVQEWAFLGVGVVWLGALLASGFLLLRRATPGDVGPAALVAGVQALWFAVPVLARRAGVLQSVEPLSVQYAAYAFLWVAIGHSVQYLWVTSYYARQSSRAPQLGRYFAKTIFAGAAIWTVPALLFAPGVLGQVPFDAGLATMVAVTVNLHHFILDGAIWKLRDGPVARVLLRAGTPAAADAVAMALSRTPLRRLVAPVVYLVGAACVAIIVTSTLEEEFGVRRAFAHGDVGRVQQASARLERMGRASPQLLANAGVLAVTTGDLDTGRREIERSLALWPTADGWRALGWLYQSSGEPEKAIVPYKTALELRPGWPQVSNDLAWIRATHTNFAVRDPAEAIRLAEQAARATRQDDPTVLDTLGAAYAAAGRFDAAAKLAERAAALAREKGKRELASEIDARLAGYRSGSPFREDPVAAASRRADARFDVTNPEGRVIDSVTTENTRR
jgi:tetratricopeptide (TPR) repeat protein